jgi:excisionase family DNA binding protein
MVNPKEGGAMPRTKKVHPEPGAEPQTPSLNGPLGEVLTLAETAAYLRLPESDLLGLIHTQGLPGRLIGGEWRFLKAAIQQWLSTPIPTPEMRKAAQMAAAGAFKDDPDLIPLVEEIYRQRGRPITEDGSYNLLHGLDMGSEQK